MKTTLSIAALCAFLVNSSWAQMTVYENNYDTQTSGNAFDEGGPFNWIDGGIGTLTVTYQDIGAGNIVVSRVGDINNTTAEAVNVRFGTKWTLAGLSGNTSPNPADYTISFDVRNVSGNWDPINLEFFVLTGAGNGVGLGSGVSPYAIADGWVHVEAGLDELTVGWWNGTGWNLTDPVWQMEVGGPGWPGTPVAPGEAFVQEWQVDNLQITMVPEPGAFTMLAVGVGLLAGWRRYRRLS